jgi:regulatory protein
MNKLRKSLSKDSLSDAKRYALKLITIRPRSEKELRDRLQNRGYNGLIIERVIETLRKLDLLNDRLLTEQLINYGLHDKGLGRLGLKAFLLKRGIDKELIDESGLNNIDEYPRALETANKIKIKYPDIPVDKLKRKIYGYLQRRGYSYDTIKEVLKNIGTENKNHD